VSWRQVAIVHRTADERYEAVTRQYFWLSTEVGTLGVIAFYR
jgi:hypothetical protein